MPQNDFVLLLYNRNYPVEASVAHVGASLFLLWIVALTWEGLLIKRLTHDPVVGKLCSAGAAWATLFLVRVTTGFAIPGIIRDFDLIGLAMLCGVALVSGLRMRAQLRLEAEEQL